MAVQPTCCDCRYYEPLPSGPTESSDGMCKIQKVGVRWYYAPCIRFRLEPLELVVDTIAHHTGALKPGLTWRLP